jgi:hypothetical protein
MKKLFCFVVILAAGGYCFFSGWVQFQIPAGSFGVLRSKTHGTDERVVQEGEFRWVWYKLIPNNAAVTVFRLKENAVSVRAAGTLPSAAAYAALSGVQADFSYEVSGAVYYSLKPENLPALASEHNLLEQADLDAYTQRLAGEVETFVLDRLWLYAEQASVLEEIMKTGSAAVLEQELAGRFPALEKWKINLKIPRFPDLALYRNIKDLYQDFTETRKKLMNDEISAAAAKNIQSRLRFEELSLYGELLSKYPSLIDYLALEKGLQPPAGER